MNISDKIAKLLCVVVIGFLAFAALLLLNGFLLYKTEIQESSRMFMVMISLLAANLLMGCIAYRLFGKVLSGIAGSACFLAILTIGAWWVSNEHGMSTEKAFAYLLSVIAAAAGGLAAKSFGRLIRKQ